MRDILVPSLMQLVASAPLLLVYVVGLALALVFRRRYPTPCLLTLIATAVLLVVTAAQPFVHQYLFLQRHERGWNEQTYGWIVSVVAITGSVVRAVAIALLLAAVFLGRSVAQRPGPTVSPSGDQGIRRP